MTREEAIARLHARYPSAVWRTASTARALVDLLATAGVLVLDPPESLRPSEPERK